MKKLLVVALLLVAARLATARGLMGERYADVSAGVIRPGERAARAYDEAVLTFGAGVNVPVHSHVDVWASAGTSRLEGENAGVRMEAENVGGRVGSLLHLAPGTGFDPAFGVGLGYSETDVTRRSARARSDRTHENTTIAGWFGVELDAGRGLSVTPYVEYTHWFDNDNIENDVAVGIGVNRWINRRWAVAADLSHEFDGRDVGISVAARRSF